MRASRNVGTGSYVKGRAEAGWPQRKVVNKLLPRRNFLLDLAVPKF